MCCHLLMLWLKSGQHYSCVDLFNHVIALILTCHYWDACQSLLKGENLAYDKRKARNYFLMEFLFIKTFASISSRARLSLQCYTLLGFLTYLWGQCSTDWLYKGHLPFFVLPFIWFDCCVTQIGFQSLSPFSLLCYSDWISIIVSIFIIVFQWQTCSPRINSMTPSLVSRSILSSHNCFLSVNSHV